MRVAERDPHFLILAEKEKTMTALDFFTKDFDKFFVGYDDMMSRYKDATKELGKLSNYPPYNIKKTNDNTYIIEMAVAGFGKSDIEVTIDGDKLSIKGNTSGDTEEAVETLWSGLALRPFTRMFTLSDKVEVKDAELVNGMLKVFLERIIPDANKPRQVEVK